MILPAPRENPGRAARHERNAIALLPEAIAILEADMHYALAVGNDTLAKSKATAVENAKRRLRIEQDRQRLS